MVALGTLPGDSTSAAGAVSADGSTVVGISYDEAFRWTSADGMVGLGDLSGGNTFSGAMGISADGSTVVGVSSSNFGFREAFRWTSDGGIVGLGFLPGHSISYALDASADGSTVVGFSEVPAGDGVAFIWDAAHGMRELDVVLSDLGLGPALSGWSLISATALSDDGLTIVGYGSSPSGKTQGWLAVIPEPGTGLIVIAGLLGLACWRRGRA